ncbi:MAG: class II fructose-bisphosphatase [Hyphomicrobiaceae bacterium]|nr:class II fructose-bisphosphatase [Hyphomicrobiaceae bacterium]
MAKKTDTESGLSRMLTLEIARVTEAAAVAAAKLRGRGDEVAADQTAVDAMRRELNRLPIKGRIVIGEGERDEAPMLYIGEEVGTGDGPDVDIAVDPLEGTTICAKAEPNSLAVVAFAEKGSLLHSPDIYMDKIAIGPGYEPGIVDLDASPKENLNALAKAKGVSVDNITACILDRPRHAKIIEAVRETGAAIRLIGDGDIAGVIHTANAAETGIDIYMGIGGAPEGVLAAAALRCIGGQMQARLHPMNDHHRERVAEIGIEDIDRKYTMQDMASGDVLFAATGVTSGSMLRGVQFKSDGVETETVIMRAKTNTVRWIRTEHGAGKQAL